MYQVLYPLAGLCGLIGCCSTTDPARAAPSATASSLSIRASVQGVERIIAQDRPYFLFQVAFFLSGSAFFMSTHIILLLTRERLRLRRLRAGAVDDGGAADCLLALSSPVWGRLLDRLGIVHCRLLIT